MIANNKKFWVGALLGAVSSLAYANQKKKQHLNESYGAKAKQLAGQVVDAAKHLGDTTHIRDKQFLYGACSLLGAAMGLYLTLNKNTRAKTLRLLSNGAHFSSNNHRKHPLTAVSRKKTTQRAKKH